MCLAQGHNVVPLVRLKPTTTRSQVKHSTTEPLHSVIILYLGLDLKASGVMSTGGWGSSA